MNRSLETKHVNNIFFNPYAIFCSQVYYTRMIVKVCIFFTLLYFLVRGLWSSLKLFRFPGADKLLSKSCHEKGTQLERSDKKFRWESSFGSSKSLNAAISVFIAGSDPEHCPEQQIERVITVTAGVQQAFSSRLRLGQLFSLVYGDKSLLLYVIVGLILKL